MGGLCSGKSKEDGDASNSIKRGSSNVEMHSHLSKSHQEDEDSGRRRSSFFGDLVGKRDSFMSSSSNHIPTRSGVGLEDLPVADFVFAPNDCAQEGGGGSVSLLGVKMCYLETFIDECGGRSALGGQTTEQVRKRYVLDATAADSSLSVCELLAKQGRGSLLGQAKWFISHCHQSHFVDLVEAIQLYMKREYGEDHYKEVLVWIDIFSYPQHTRVPKTSLWFGDVLKAVIGSKFTNVLLVLLPWDEPLVLSRAWCVMEMYACESTCARFEVAMTSAESSRLRASLQAEPSDFSAMLSRCVKSVEATKVSSFPPDAHRIAEYFAHKPPLEITTAVAACATTTSASSSSSSSSSAAAATGEAAAAAAEAKAEAVVVSKVDVAKEEKASAVMTTKVAAADDHQHHQVQSHEQQQQHHHHHHHEHDPIAEESAAAASFQALDEVLSRMLVQWIDKYIHRQIDVAMSSKKKKEAAKWRYSLSSILIAQGRFQEALPLANSSKIVFEGTVGREHIDTMLSSMNLALVHKAMGKLAEAEALFLRNKSDGEKVFTRDHFVVTTAVKELVLLYEQQGNYASLEPLLTRVLEDNDRALGRYHEVTVQSLSVLVKCLVHQHKYVQAEPFMLRFREDCEHTLGADDPQTLKAVKQLGLLALRQNNYDLAEPLLTKYLIDCERVLGNDHLDTFAAVKQLIGMYKSRLEGGDEDEEQGRQSEQMRMSLDMAGAAASLEPLMIRYVADCERILGPDEQETLTAVNALSSHYLHHGQFALAEPYVARLCEKRRRVLGEDNLLTLRCTANLASLFYAQDKFKEAEPLLRGSIAAFERVCGKDKPDIIKLTNTLANLCEKQGRTAEAESLYLRCLADRERIAGEDGEETVAYVAVIVAFYSRIGRMDKAAPYLHRIGQTDEDDDDDDGDEEEEEDGDKKEEAAHKVGGAVGEEEEEEEDE